MRQIFDLEADVFEENGKNLERIHKSKIGRNGLIQLFGLDSLPSSVIRAKRTPADPDEDTFVVERSYDATTPYLSQSKNVRLPKQLRTSYRVSGKGCASGALSRFPQNVGRTTVLFYSEPGDVVVDPFAGHNSRMDLCVREGRHYFGCDMSTEFMRFNFKRAKVLRKRFPKANIELYHCDSRQMQIANGVGDFTLTSPPYYDIEYYGDEPEQLGKSKTYKEFLDGIGQVLKENFRCLKPGAFAVWFINDFRRNGTMHFYHMDILRLGRKAGFIPHDLMVVDFGRSIADCFINQSMERKILPKRHEFGIVLRKPDSADSDN